MTLEHDKAKPNPDALLSSLHPERRQTARFGTVWGLLSRPGKGAMSATASSSAPNRAFQYEVAPSPSLSTPPRTEPRALLPTKTAKMRMSGTVPPSAEIGRTPTVGVAVVRRLRHSSTPLKNLRDLTGRDSPRPACPLTGEQQRVVFNPPHDTVASDSPVGVADSVRSGFDKLSFSIDTIVGALPDDDLEARLIRVGKWVERYQFDQQPGEVASRLLPLLQAARAETAALVVPNISMLAASASALYQTILLLNVMYPDFAQVSLPSFRMMLRSVFFHDPFEAKRDGEEPNPPLLFTETADPAKALKDSIIFFSGKTYFQALRDVSKRLGQAVHHFEQQSQEREKLCSALNKIISVWQLMYTGSLFRGWRSVRYQRLQLEGVESVLKQTDQDKRRVEAKLKRVDTVVEETKDEKNKEIQILRDGIKRAEEDASRIREENRTLRTKLAQTEERLDDYIERTTELKNILEKQKRDSDLKYANLACRAFKLISRSRPAKFETDRLESEWSSFYGINTCTPSGLDSSVGAVPKTFGVLSPSGQPEKLIAWLNRLSSSSLTLRHSIPPITTLDGSPGFCNVLSSALHVLSPEHVTMAEVEEVFGADKVNKGRMVLKLLVALQLPKVVTEGDIMEPSGGGLKNFLLCTMLHLRFLTPSIGMLQCQIAYNDPNKEVQEEPKAWEEYDVAGGLYNDEHPIPEVVRKYLKASPSAVSACYESAKEKVALFENISQVITHNLFESFAVILADKQKGFKTDFTDDAIADLGCFIGFEHITFARSDNAVLSACDMTDFMEIKQILKRHFCQLRLIYLHYGGGGAGGQRASALNSAASTHSSFSTGSFSVELHFEDLWKIMLDCGVDQKSTGIDRSSLKEAFSAARKVESNNASGGQAALSARDFIYALILIAHTRFSHRHHTTLPTLSSKLDHFLKNYILPESSYIDGTFIRLFSDDELSRKVLEKRKADVMRLFKHYSNRDGAAERRQTKVVATQSEDVCANVMSSKEFLIFCGEAKITDELCTIASVSQVYKSYTSVSYSEDGPGGGGIQGMDQLGFSMALCGLSAYKFPNPSTPLHLRLLRMWQSAILVNLHKKLKLTDGIEFDGEEGIKD